MSCRFLYSLTKTILYHQVIIEATVGSSFAGDIAIDDVTMTTGDCFSTQVCNFETDFCEWVNVGGNILL